MALARIAAELTDGARCGEAAAGPHVACVLPTRDRPRFVRQAVAYFLRQDYPSRSLIVLDDGAEPVADLIPSGDPRLSYVRLDPRQRLPRGAKRNQGCELAPEGALIAHWDDDDWMAPDRLSRQVRALLESQADLCTAAGTLHYRPATGQSWRECGDRPSSSTLLYRKSAWRRSRLADRTGGEEARLLRGITPERVVRMPAADFCVVVLHDGNSVGRNLGDRSRWEPVSTGSAVAPLLGADAAFYARDRERIVRARGVSRVASSVAPTITPFTSPSVSNSSVTLAAPFLVYDGYGSMAEHLALGLQHAGTKVHLRPLILDLTGADPTLVRLARESRPEPGAPVLYFCWPRPDLDRDPLGPDGPLFVNTMWEGTLLPEGWVERLNRARAVIAPTSWVADVFRASGVTRPVWVLPEGVDPDTYRYVNRPERAGITTLMVGPVAPRKNTLVGIEAWKRAFADDPEARLILKARFGCSRYTPDDPRIRLVDENEATRGIAHWYAEADVLLALGSEGFGLPLVEGMATGLPVIALDAAGQADTVLGAGPNRVLPVPASEWVPFDAGNPHSSGLRPAPDVSAVAERLRWVARHREDARSMGRAASEWARRERNIHQKAPALLDLMEGSLGRSAGVLRRAPTLWTPSRGGACGVAEYALHLTRGLVEQRGEQPPRHSQTAPEPLGASVAHLQHEWSLFPDQAALTAYVHRAHAHGVPVAVTEHTIFSAATPFQPWEREADALVSLTEQGARRLRERHPDRNVMWIPPGCPEYFPPRKKERGRVLGAFGFLWPHKGFWKLLDLLRAERERGGPATELLLFSHAHNPEIAARWEAAAAGLPARRIDEFLPVEVVARRLAAEADALVFWYECASHESASYAVRVGLSTGVPVLCSPTGWFRDVAAATHQPAGATDADLADGVERVLTDDTLRNRLTEAARHYCHEHRWTQIARRHRELWSRLEATARH
ncbi:MAG: glycosyltransferase [Actinomycetota bacterium]